MNGGVLSCSSCYSATTNRVRFFANKIGSMKMAIYNWLYPVTTIGKFARVVIYDDFLTMSPNSVQSEKTLNKSVYILFRAILKKNNKERGVDSRPSQNDCYFKKTSKINNK